MIKQNKKLDKEALAWSNDWAVFNLTDCSDSMHSMELLEARFSVLTDDTEKVLDYVLEYHPDKLVEIIKETFDQYVYWAEEKSLEKSLGNFPDEVIKLIKNNL